MKIPVSGQGIIYTLRSEETLDQLKEKIISNSFGQIKEVEIQPEAAHVSDLMLQGKFQLTVNKSQRYQVYPDYATMLQMQKSQQFTNAPIAKNLILTQYFDIVRQQMAANPGLDFDQLQNKCVEIYAQQMKHNDGAIKYYQDLK